MDSLTHIVLGAAIGDRMMGKRIGRKAAWIGALAKTFPDFDLIFSGLDDPRKYILYHRSYTHSFFVELLTAFPLAWLCFIMFKKKVSYKEWFLLWLVCMWAHSLLDICTNYGTRIFLPFSATPVSLNNIAIADLFFTAPMLLLVVVSLFFKNESRPRKIMMKSTLVYACLYLAFTFVNKVVVDMHFKRSLKENQEVYTHYMSNPSILNNILWYSVVSNDSVLKVAEYTLLDDEDPIVWHHYPVNRDLLEGSESPDAPMLLWFSQGFHFSRQNGDTIDVFIPKFGRGNLDKTEARETFLFYYQLYKVNGEWKMGAHQPSNREMNFAEAFAQLVRKVRGQ